MGNRSISEDGQRSRLGRIWFEMAALLIAIGLAVHQRAPFVLAACLLTAIPVAWLWNWLSLRRVEYERRFDKRRAFPGETFEMTLRVTNRKLLPLSWLEIKDSVPTALPLLEGVLEPTHVPQVSRLTAVFSLRWYERVNRRYVLQCPARGVFMLGPMDIRSGDIFTLFEMRESRKHQDRLIIYPRVWAMEELGFPSKEPFGERKAYQRLLEDPLRTIGVRDYHPEDSLRRIHWKATARRGELQVRALGGR